MVNEDQQQTALTGGGGSSGSAIDVQRIISIFRRRLPLFLIVAGLIAAAVIAFSLQQTPVYSSTAGVTINTRTERVVNSQAVLSNLPVDNAVADTEVEVLKSPELAQRVVEALKLQEDPEFNSRLKKPSLLGGIKQAVGLGASRAAPTTPAEVEAEKQKVVNKVMEARGVRRLGLTYSMNISFESESPFKAAKIANAFADLYLLGQQKSKFDASQQASNFLNSRLEDLRAQVQEADAAVSNYRIANNLLSSEGATLTEQEISAYNQQLASTRAQQAEEEARLRTARAQLAAGSDGDDVGEALSSNVVQQLRARRAQVSGRVAELSSRYGPLHPDMQRAQRELADIDTEISREIGRIISNLEARVQVARERTASVGRSLGSARGTLASNSAASVRLAELERNAESVRTIYQSYLDRFKETGAQAGTEQSDARIVSRASVPNKPSSPNIPLNIALGLILGMAAGVAAVVVAEMIDAGLATSEDVERRLGVAHVGSIPLMSSIAEPGERSIPPIDYVLRKPLSGFAEAFRALRTSIVYSSAGPGSKIIAITSALPAEGKTTTSVSLARVTAQAGSKVLLLDCDVRRRAVTRSLGLEPKVGLSELLTGKATLEQTLMLDQASGAYILPLAHVTSTVEDLFDSPAMDELLAKVRPQFDMIILDTAPVLALAETRILAVKADVVVLLARWRKTPSRAVSSSLRLLHQAGADIAGVALTQVDMNAQSKHGYGDAGYYYDEYKKYYAT